MRNGHRLEETRWMRLPSALRDAGLDPGTEEGSNGQPVQIWIKLSMELMVL